jgi:hypothetical protein
VAGSGTREEDRGIHRLDRLVGAVTVETTTLTDADEAVQTMDATILFPRP